MKGNIPMDMKKEFNLLEEPWIKVVHADCREEEVSLIDIFLNAHNYLDLSGDTSAQDIAVLRLLLAILHAVFEQTDEEGNEAPIDDLDGAYERWESIWKRGSFPEAPIRDYLEHWKERFWLFHPETPFWQFPQAETASEYSAAKLNGMISESANKIRLFSPRSSTSKNCLTYSEAARWLLYLNGFDDGAVKPSKQEKALGKDKRVVMGISWLGELGLIQAVGENLFETLMLNLVLLDKDQEPWESAEPIWEKTPFTQMICREIIPKADQAALLTVQSRRMLLTRSGGMVTGYHIVKGDRIEKKNCFLEQMTLWKEINDKTEDYYVPRTHQRNVKIWREFSSMVRPANDNCLPGLIKWLNRLIGKKLMDRSLVRFRSVGVRYDSSQMSAVTDCFDDSLSFHSAILLDSGKEWIETIENEVDWCDQLAKIVGWFAIQLDYAGGNKKDSSGNKEKEQFYYRIDIPFREWLLKLDPNQGDTDRIALQSEWRTTAFRIAEVLGQEMVNSSGPAAYSGRIVKKNESDPGVFYSAPKAYVSFKYRINKWRKGEKI